MQWSLVHRFTILKSSRVFEYILGGCISRPSGFSPSTQCIKPRFKGIHISEIIKNKEIANRRVGFRTRNTSQSIWVRRYSSGCKCIISYFLFKEYKEFLKRRNRRIFPKSKFINWDDQRDAIKDKNSLWKRFNQNWIK